MSTKRHTLATKAVKKRRKPVSAAKSKRFPIRMRNWVFEGGQIAAKQQNRSLASLMEALLILHLRENDLIPENVEIELRQLQMRKDYGLKARGARGGAR